jgi:hypothetical protein
MLEDIPDRFNQVVNRPTRPLHPGGRPTSEARTAPRRVVSIPGASGPVNAAGSGDTGTSPVEPGAAARIVSAPGPGEVAAPRWWARGAGSSGDVERPAE